MLHSLFFPRSNRSPSIESSTPTHKPPPSVTVAAREPSRSQVQGTQTRHSARMTLSAEHSTLSLANPSPFQSIRANTIAAKSIPIVRLLSFVSAARQRRLPASRACSRFLILHSARQQQSRAASGGRDHIGILHSARRSAILRTIHFIYALFDSAVAILFLIDSVA